jgi:hypothetical protein
MHVAAVRGHSGIRGAAEWRIGAENSEEKDASLLGHSVCVVAHRRQRPTASNRIGRADSSVSVVGDSLMTAATRCHVWSKRRRQAQPRRRV